MRVCGHVCCTRVCVSAYEGGVAVCVKQEAISNYEWCGSPSLPGVYDSTDAEGEYSFRDDDVPHYGLYRVIHVVYISPMVVIDHEYGQEKFLGDLFVPLFRPGG
jgi:hypothetical protein